MDENTQAVNSTSDDSGEDFYELIEAPKFVDFTVSDPYVPDDRYWFCSRVGCEEVHPEEMDSDVVYKNFVMRVMAARSPNVRLQRVRRNLKCPLTAPPKSSKSRVARLALISSISKRIGDSRVKSRLPTANPATTANVKPKQAHAKAMTTPRNRKLNSNTNSFLSVKNSKTTSAEEPKTTKVAKALFFQSPKKDTKKRTSTEMNTPVKTICAAMKKLEITSANKNVLGHEKNVLGDGESLPQDVPRKKLRGREVKSRVFDSLRTQGCKLQDAKSARVLKRRSKERKIKPPLAQHVAPENVDEDASDMDIDVKSRQVSMQGCSLSVSSKSKEGNPDGLSRPEDSDNLSKDSARTSISNYEERISAKSDLEVVQCKVEDKKNQLYYHEEKVKPGVLDMNILEVLVSDDKENVAEISDGNRDEMVLQIVEPLNNNSDDDTKVSNPEEKNSEAIDFNTVLCEVEPEKNKKCNREGRMKSGEVQKNISKLESDDKENVVGASKDNAVPSDDDIEHESETTTDENVAPNDNREDNSHDQSATVAFGKLVRSNAAKVKEVLKKTVKETSTPATVGSHGLKPSRPKSTNPKPFRLRTDERGVLREANLGKKLHCPLKDITASRRHHGDKLQRKNQCTNQNSECENRVEEEHEQRRLENKFPDDPQGGTILDYSSSNKKGDSEHKLCTMDSQNCFALKHQKPRHCRQFEPGNKRATKTTDDNLKKTNLQKIQQRVRKPRRDLSPKEEITSLVPSQHKARKETSLKISSHKEARKPSEALSRKRRPAATIPKEPNLHGNHLPRRAAQENWLR
ncbi:myb-like protein X isoform X3 [Cucumis melo var. makuwa]|uniref:Myb-like protein X isoform X3 n=1 Tax=Cucumis melo var. makuwa TaxID=1194695 RepID=A0A5A7SPI3_CUCMM|nr:myb-like protein X isoform X3 [Cucumis melo var. makuwa]TYK06848.1 myb-like protein X isoform X3 [Cucumis melo var. makuwa]